MTTGARRGELCAARWRDIDLPKGLLRLYGSKTGKDRRVALDPTSVAVLGEQRQRYENRVAQLGSVPREDAFVFSKSPDHSTPLDPRSVTQRYKRMVTKLGIDSHLHTLRHYSATELIAGGVDVRTVAGRLGHADATTTLKVYAAWLSEADQRASQSLFARLPERPAVVPATPRHPHERIAAEIRTEIIAGTYPPASALPTVKEIAAAHDVSVGTAHRAIENLSSWGFVAVRRGVRATVTERENWPPIEAPPEKTPPIEQSASAVTDVKKRLYEFQLRHADESVWKFTAAADISSVDDLRRILLRAVQRTAPTGQAADYELDVYEIGGDIVTTFIDFAA
jgi:DNA-binding transcriptional regulator YhcF (GntR family)